MTNVTNADFTRLPMTLSPDAPGNDTIQKSLIQALEKAVEALLAELVQENSNGAASQGQADTAPGVGNSHAGGGTGIATGGLHGRPGSSGGVSSSGDSNPENSKAGPSSPTAVPAQAAGDTGHLGGANTVPNRIASPEAARNMVDQVKQAGGGTLRIQMSHNEINDPGQMAKLKAMVDQGDKQGVKIQFTFRDNDNGGGGNVLTGNALKQACGDIRNVVSQLGAHRSFALDTFNEGGRSASQDWANMQTALITSARDAGYKGQITVEDSNWGGGLTAGGESGLVKYKAQLEAANGAGNPGLVGSIHEYSNGSDATSRLSSEIKALEGAGYKPQIGEVGNANWTGGSSFQERDGAVQAVKNNISALREAGAEVLPWMDQFVDGKISHEVGFKKSDQLI